MRNRFGLSLSGLEKKLLAVFTAMFFVSNIGIIHAFYVENSSVRPASGGSIVEGVVGTIDPNYSFNPLFADGLEEDVVNLVFAGLMRYNAETGEIKDHLATHTLSPNKEVYEFTLRGDILWHDGRPVSADDVMFTYRDVIQHPEFSNTFLKNTFADVQIEKVDNLTVRFTIPEKRKTFFTNFTLGLLPQHLLVGTPVSGLEFDSFNQEPIGCGPYRFEGIFRQPEFTEVRLAAFPDAYPNAPKVETISLRVFGNQKQLLANVNKLDAIRPIRTQEAKEIGGNDRFQKIEVIGPRYVAVFFNLKDETLTTKFIRQAMRAAIDLDGMAEQFDATRVDTPLVELWPQADIVNTSITRAGELMREAGYFFRSEKTPEPQEEPVEEVTTETPTRAVTLSPTPNPAFQDAVYVTEPSDKKWSATSQSRFFLIGTIPDNTSRVTVNGYQLQLFDPTTGRFSYLADTAIGTLNQGENVYNIEFLGTGGELLDRESVTIFYSADAATLEAARDELIPPEITLEPEPVAIEVSPTAVHAAADEKADVYRIDADGKHVRLSLTYLESFDYLREIAEQLQSDWLDIGIEIELRPMNADDFRYSVRARDYELIILPQHLGYNLDSYPYFHLSQVGEGGFNFSEWKNLKASVLLEEIRSTHDAEKRQTDLQELSGIFIDDVPAITLFTPRYTWLVDEKVKNNTINHMAVIPDRYSLVNDFYIREARQFSDDASALGYFPWFREQNKQFFSFSTDE